MASPVKSSAVITSDPATLWLIYRKNSSLRGALFASWQSIVFKAFFETVSSPYKRQRNLKNRVNKTRGNPGSSPDKRQDDVESL